MYAARVFSVAFQIDPCTEPFVQFTGQQIKQRHGLSARDPGKQPAYDILGLPAKHPFGAGSPELDNSLSVQG
jgi:hypothetical protein